jgi:hypothetical protein
MNGINQFLVYMVAAMVVYFAVLTFTVRKRSPRPYIKLFLLALIVTVGGMIFARITYGKELPWWIFYAIPVLLTYIFPPVILRMSRHELLIYIPLALLIGPAIHIFFSFFFGWHEYMPLFYIPWWRDLIS